MNIKLAALVETLRTFIYVAAVFVLITIVSWLTHPLFALGLFCFVGLYLLNLDKLEYRQTLENRNKDLK